MSPAAHRASSVFHQPSSPLSPKMESLAIPSQAPRRRPPRQTSSSSAALKLPSLPRFHPANFESRQPSAAGTPATGPNSPQPPMSPRSQQKQYSDAQRQLYVYQRELLASAAKTARTVSCQNPASPRLVPMGSPGPVTPLELEGQGGYLVSGATSPSACLNEATQGELVDKLIREEARRRGEQPVYATAGAR